MRKRLLHFTGSLVLGAAFAASLTNSMAQPQAAPAGTARVDKKQNAASHGSQQQGEEGQRIFEQNCSRCHNAPEGFSPNISGTVVRHMRVRASLSKHEEEELLRFFNP